jgi:hypothetical protein
MDGDGTCHLWFFKNMWSAWDLAKEEIRVVMAGR